MDYASEEWFDSFYGDPNAVEVPTKKVNFHWELPSVTTKVAVITLPPTVGRRFR